MPKLEEHAERLERDRGGKRDVESPVGSLAHQCGQLIARQCDLPVDHVEIGLGAGAARTGLRKFAVILQLLRCALAHQFGALVALRQRFLGRGAIRHQLHQIGVGAGDGGGKGQPCRGQIHLRGVGIGGGGGEGRAIGAEKIEIIAGVAGDLSLVVPAMGQEGLELLGEALVQALARFRNRAVGGEVRVKRGARLLGRGVRFLHPRFGDADVGAAGKTFGDQSVELRVVIGRPPILGGPVRSGRGEAFLAGEACFRLGLRHGAQIGGAGREQAQRQDRQ